MNNDDTIPGQVISSQVVRQRGWKRWFYTGRHRRPTPYLAAGAAVLALAGGSWYLGAHHTTVTPAASQKPAPAYTAPVSPVIPPTPAPAPTTPTVTLTGVTCVTGWVDTSSQFHAGEDTNPPDAAGVDPLYYEDAYEVTLDNTEGTGSVTVSEIDVVFTNGASEMGDTDVAGAWTVLPGYSWTQWFNMPSGVETVSSPTCTVANWWGSTP